MYSNTLNPLMLTPITQDEVAIALSNCNENIMENSTSVHATAVHPYVSMTMLIFVLWLLFSLLLILEWILFSSFVRITYDH